MFEIYKPGKAPWLAREQFPIYGSMKNLLSELCKNYQDYGNSPHAAIVATEHICANEPGKAKLIREAKQQMTKIVAAKQQTQTSNRNEDLQMLTHVENAEILACVEQIAKAECKRNTLQYADALKALDEHDALRPQGTDQSEAFQNWEDEHRKLEEEALDWKLVTEKDEERVSAKRWHEEEIKQAVATFKQTRQSIAGFFKQASQTEEKVNNAEQEIEITWITLVKCNVLHHKSQGAAAVNFGMPLTSAQEDTLKSIAQDEGQCDMQKSPGETIFSFVGKLQTQEKLSTWIARSLLPTADIATELLRTDGTLFRTLKRNLPQHLSWAAQMISSDSIERGNTFQQLAAKIYEANENEEHSSEGGLKSVTSDLKKAPPEKKHVSFLATKGRLERNPNARITQEERREKSSTETTTTFKPKKRKQAVNDDSDDDSQTVGVLSHDNEEGEDRVSVH